MTLIDVLQVLGGLLILAALLLRRRESRGGGRAGLPSRRLDGFPGLTTHFAVAPAAAAVVAGAHLASTAIGTVGAGLVLGPELLQVASPGAPAPQARPLKLAPARTPAAVPAADLAAARALRNLPIVYRRPQTMRYGKPNLFELVIASKDLQAARQQVASLPGVEKIEPVQLSDQVKAVLWSGDEGVVIKARDEDTKAVTGLANVHWVWSVTPKTDGDVTLTLALYNVISKDRKIDGPAYADTFVVHKPMSQKVIDGIGAWNPVWVALTGAAALVAGWIAWLVRRLMRKPASPPFKFKKPEAKTKR